MFNCCKKKSVGSWPIALLIGMIGGAALCCVYRKKLKKLMPCCKKHGMGGDADGQIDTPDVEYDYDFDDGASAYGNCCGYETARNLTLAEDGDK